MNSYRVFLLDTTNVAQPTASVAFIKAPKYKDAWERARLALNDADEAKKQGAVYTDDEKGEKVWKRPANAKDLTVAKIVECKQRNVKLDKAALQAIINDPKKTDAEKLEAMKQLTA